MDFRLHEIVCTRASLRVFQYFGLLVVLIFVLGLGFSLFSNWLGGATHFTALCGQAIEMEHMDVARRHFAEGEQPIRIRPLHDLSSVAFFGSTELGELQPPCILIERHQRRGFWSPPIEHTELPEVPFSDIAWWTKSHQHFSELVLLAPLLAILAVIFMLDRVAIDRLAAELRFPVWREWVLPGIAGTVLAPVILSTAFQFWPDDASFVQSTDSRLGSILVVAMLVFFLPVAEELFFRGTLFRIMIDAGRPWLGLALVSWLFAALHLLASLPILREGAGLIAFWIIFAVTFLGSSVLCALYWWRRSLMACIVLHASYNTSALVLSIVFLA